MKDADIIFLPYNYLVDKHSRESQKVDVKNAILIFDEAHNLVYRRKGVDALGFIPIGKFLWRSDFF